MNEAPEPNRTYIVSLSGGMGSALAAERALQRYGQQVMLWFADVRFEDDDLYRFLDDCAKRWRDLYGVELHKHINKRNPLEAAAYQCLVPTQRRAPCTKMLKIDPFKKYITTLEGPLTIMLGMDWKEQHRLAAPRESYGKLGYEVDYPLMWKPWELRPYQEVVREWGIEPPRLYAYGFPHNNCGGRCVKQGIREWLRLRYHFPERFAEVRDWELANREKSAARANRTINHEKHGGKKFPVTLAEIERRLVEEDAYTEQMDEIINGTQIVDDRIHCFCEYA